MKRRPNIDYRNFDWTKQNVELEREHGLGSGTISNARKRLGKPRAERHQQHNGQAALAKKLETVELGNEPYTELAQRLNVAVGTLYNHLSKNGLVVPKRRHDWATVDWSESNTEIANRLKTNPSLVSERRQHYAPPEQKNLKRGPARKGTA